MTAAAPRTEALSTAGNTWALTPSVVFAACSVLLALPPLGFFFLFTWPVHLILAILGVVFGSIAARGARRRKKVLAVCAVAASTLGILYILGWIGYWHLLSAAQPGPPPGA